MLEEELMDQMDPSYKQFAARITPTVNPDTILGIRVPVLRKYATRLIREKRAQEFLHTPHVYYEEYLVHAFLLSKEKDEKQCLRDIEAFLPCINNWAVCDSIRPKVLTKDNALLRRYINKWLKSKKPYTIRLAIEFLMAYCLGNDYQRSDLNTVACIHCDHYYVQMMQGWYFAEAMINHYEDVLAVIPDMDNEVRRKTIRKAIESYRIAEQQKKELRTLL